MWSKLKALPVFPKVLIVFLILGLLYKAGKTTQPHSYSGEGYSTSRGSDNVDAAGRGSHGNTAADQALAEFQAEQIQLQARAAQCEQEMTAATNRQAMAAMNGVMYNNRPACEQQMPAYIAREAYLETEIYRLKTGDRSSSLREITGIQNASRSASPSSGYAHSDDGTESVENYDRQAIRGNSLYTDESGQPHELPTQDYYYRDRSSGRILGSDQPNPPNDGRDYEQFQPANQPR